MPRLAHKQRLAEDLFQAFDLHAQGGRGAKQLLGSAGKAAALSNRHKVRNTSLSSSGKAARLGAILES